MKKLVLTLIICSFFAATSVFGQQWLGPDNTIGSINRSGNVGIGISTPVSRLDIKSDEYPVLGGGYDYIPQLRLQALIMVVQLFIVIIKATYFLSLVVQMQVIS